MDYSKVHLYNNGREMLFDKLLYDYYIIKMT
jgi:hypothetical protein